MGTDRKAFDEARKCMRRLRTLRGVRVSFNRAADCFQVILSGDKLLTFSPDENPVLATARFSDLAAVELTPSGLGLYWPKLDVDMYIPALIERAVMKDDSDDTSSDRCSASGSRRVQRWRALKGMGQGRRARRSIAA